MLYLQNYRLIAVALLCGLLMVSFFLLGSGCKRGEAPPPPPPSSDLITDPEQKDIVAIWQGSKHADTYVLSKEGVNNACANCHSPINWVPTNKADLPKTCQSCLIPFELKEPDTPVSEGDWDSVECSVCHVIANGSAASVVSWLDMLQTMPGEDMVYTKVSSNTELCQKCHTNRGTFLYAVDLGNGAHASKLCTACHEPHSLVADCKGCHKSLTTSGSVTAQNSHQAAMAKVACVACHGNDPVLTSVGWDNAVTKKVFTVGSGTPFVTGNTHIITKTAKACVTCHFSGNKWGISVK